MSVYTNEGKKRLTLEGLVAADLSYDNSESGLAASNVQAALDEVAIASQIYAAYIRSSLGASVVGVFNDAASAWTVSQTTNPGLFRVTHNLNLASINDLAVTPVVCLSGGGTDDRFCNVTNRDPDYFEVNVVDIGSGAVNEDFSFTAIRLVPP